MSEKKEIKIIVNEEVEFSQDVQIPLEKAKEFEEEVKRYIASEKTKTIIKENVVSSISPIVSISNEVEDYLISNMEIEEE